MAQPSQQSLLQRVDPFCYLVPPPPSSSSLSPSGNRGRARHGHRRCRQRRRSGDDDDDDVYYTQTSSHIHDGDDDDSDDDDDMDMLDDAVAARRPNTLLGIAHHYARVPLSDVRACNTALDDVAANAALPPATRVRLPAVTAQRGWPCGVYFVLGDAEARVRACEAALDAVLARYRQQRTSSHEATTRDGDKDASTAHEQQLQQRLLALPPRTVLSPTEWVVRRMHAEAARQLPAVEAAYTQLGQKDQQLHHLVDVDAVREAEVAAAAAFAPTRVQLHSYRPENAAALHVPAARAGTTSAAAAAATTTTAAAAIAAAMPHHNFEYQQLRETSELTPGALQTCADTSDDYCVQPHTHRWECVVCAPHSLEEQDAWAVLSCQSLTALIDALASCTTAQLPGADNTTSPSSSSPNNNNNSSSNSNTFLFIAGTFYVDDRPQHAIAVVANDNNNNNDDDDDNDAVAAIRDADVTLLAPAYTTHNNNNNNNNDDDDTDNDDDDDDDDDEHTSRRHASALSSLLTLSTSSTVPRGRVGGNAAYGRCPVRSAATTTFAQLRVKLGELCVLHHHNGCIHYLYLHAISSLRGRPRTERAAYPHRVMRRRTRALRCRACRQFPATVALYGDALSPNNSSSGSGSGSGGVAPCTNSSSSSSHHNGAAAAEPSLYCEVCYDMLHGDESAQASAAYLAIRPRDVGEYYKYY